MSATKKSKRKAVIKTKASNKKTIQLNIFRQPNQIETEKLINGLWSVVKSSLWVNRIFTMKESEELKELIADHFFNGKNNKRNFKDLVERICLAKRYLARKRGRYISKPQDWLNVHYPKGLAGTASWLEQVNTVRKDVPEYNKGITTLANGIIKYMESPNIIVFNRYKAMLVEQKQFDLLQIFYNTIINLQYAI